MVGTFTASCIHIKRSNSLLESGTTVTIEKKWTAALMTALRQGAMLRQTAVLTLNLQVLTREEHGKKAKNFPCWRKVLKVTYQMTVQTCEWLHFALEYQTKGRGSPYA